MSYSSQWGKMRQIWKKICSQFAWPGFNRGDHEPNHPGNRCPFFCQCLTKQGECGGCQCKLRASVFCAFLALSGVGKKVWKNTDFTQIWFLVRRMVIRAIDNWHTMDCIAHLCKILCHVLGELLSAICMRLELSVTAMHAVNYMAFQHHLLQGKIKLIAEPNTTYVETRPILGCLDPMSYNTSVCSFLLYTFQCLLQVSTFHCTVWWVDGKVGDVPKMVQGRKYLPI